MTDRDEHLEKALQAMETYDVSSVEAAFGEITLSPLGELIDTILPNVEPGALRATLERIRNMKQGTFDDLADVEFQSFLTSYLRVDFALLQRIIQILRTHHMVCTSADNSLALAARGGSSSDISNDELLDNLARRQFADS